MKTSRHRVLILSLLLLGTCQDGEETDAAPSVPFDSVFHVVSEITLEEAENDPIIEVERITISAGGLIAFADSRAERVRVFDPFGAPVATLGRAGEGPGEFRVPVVAEFGSGGGLFVSDASLARITRYTLGFDLDTIYPSPEVYTSRLSRDSDGFLAVVNDGTVLRVFRMSRDGTVERTYPLPDSSAQKVPYWGAILRREFAVLEDAVIVGTNLLYPLWRFAAGAVKPDSFGFPPASFVFAPEPDPGQFAGGAPRDFFDWARTFSVIAGVFSYQGSHLIVVHGRFDPLPEHTGNIEHTSLDLYDRNGNKLYEDIPLPGRFLGAQKYVYVLIKSPPEAWAIRVYSLAGAPKSEEFSSLRQ